MDDDALRAEIEHYPNLVSWFQACCQRYADASAFTCQGGTLTYSELDERSSRLASWLQRSPNLRPGDRVAIHLPNLLQFPVAVFGILKAGMVVVNTNPLYSVEELRHQFADSGVRAVITLANSAYLVEKVLPDTEIREVIVTQLADLHSFPKSDWINFKARHVRKIVPRYKIPNAISFRKCLREGAKHPWRPVEVERHQLAFLQYTGGVTGTSKGVMLTHHNILANICQLKTVMNQVCTPREEIAIAPLPLYHTYSLILNGMLMLEDGAHVVLIINPRDTEGFVKELSRWRFTVFSGLNTLFVELCQNQDFCALDFSSLKVTVSGAMSLTRFTEGLWIEVTGSPIQEGYGLTECSPVVAVHPPNEERRDDTVGPPVPLTEVKVVGSEGETLHPGEVGEICVRGPQVMAGYWQQPELTRAVLQDDGWFLTGDMGTLSEEGYIEVIDRKSEVIRTAGFDVYPSELENVIACHPDVLECAVVGLPDDDLGEVIKLFVVSRNRRLTVKAVRDYCRERLTSYKVPRQVEFRTSLPKTNVGKVLHRDIRDEELTRQAKKKRHL
ncbi:AMP-binding protein [Pontibacterium sp.]|uniref:AMP-binding protein n=1 Tax=Pontibacterium sp. TaxID=2036026 RepID=UPI0035178D1B